MSEGKLCSSRASLLRRLQVIERCVILTDRVDRGSGRINRLPACLLAAAVLQGSIPARASQPGLQDHRTPGLPGLDDNASHSYNPPSPGERSGPSKAGSLPRVTSPNMASRSCFSRRMLEEDEDEEVQKSSIMIISYGRAPTFLHRLPPRPAPEHSETLARKGPGLPFLPLLPRCRAEIAANAWRNE